ncbi:hypothetical protein EIP91_002264 [Steccherinum ochraceum]|uniref:Cytochrome P450-dit2 n=1 Tax=Steccherinum ochraceum TaxID=92696 RepID=A0A4R0RIS6_9APHY|nr:hypothetical protein EIP91_002264 [Steccherinum ochraceum]
MAGMNTLFTLVLTLGAILAIRKVAAFRKAIWQINGHPGLRTLLDVWGLASALPSMPWINGGGRTAWNKKHDTYAELGVDVVSYVSALPSTSISFAVADAAAVKAITGSRQRFPKPIALYKGLRLFGGNIVASEGDEWKRYRKISAPSFSERNNRLVWDETVGVMNELFETVWGGKTEIESDHALLVTMPIALFVISAAGFGRRMSWKEENGHSADDQLSFKDTWHDVSEGFILKVLVPKWATHFNKRVRQAHFAFDELERYIKEMIESRRNEEDKEERHDLLTSLLAANDDDSDGHARLTDEELLSNIFIFLAAGHETTAHSLCFTFGLLALYQDEQERAYQEIIKAIPDGRDPTFHDLPSLSYVEAVINETLRMYPAVISLPKLCAEDTTVPMTSSSGETHMIPIPAGATVHVHVLGLHYNPKYWEEPHQFNPSRFLGDWPRDAFLPFSGGARSCLGRRFSELESVVAITMILQKYKITVKEEPEFAGETFEQRKERVLLAKPGITLTPTRVPLVFTRRD